MTIPTTLEVHQDNFTLSTDAKKLQLDAILLLLSKAWWAQSRTKEMIERSLQHSLCFGLYDNDKQIGLARVITDYATFAYLSDVFIEEKYQGQGLGKWLMSIVMTHPDLQGLRRWALSTRDAQEFYHQFGWTPLNYPERWMEILVETKKL